MLRRLRQQWARLLQSDMPSKAARGYLSQLVFGTSDGLLAALAITLAVGSKGRGAVLLALFAVFIAGACGMAVGQFLSAERNEVGWNPSLLGSSVCRLLL